MGATSVTGFGKGSGQVTLGVDKIASGPGDLPPGATMIIVVDDESVMDQLGRIYAYQASYIVTKDGKMLKDRYGNGTISLPSKVVKRCDQRYRSIDET